MEKLILEAENRISPTEDVGHYDLADNIILSSDAYKMTHWVLYPEGTERVYSYLESRGSDMFPSTMFYGLQIYLKKYLEGVVVEQWMVDEAEEFCNKVFGANYFNRDGWQRIIDVHGGKMPIRIRAVPEGTVVPNRNVLVTMENTDEKLPWVTNFLETLLFEAEWYGSTVATISYSIKQLINKYAIRAGETVSPFHLNDFGFRGVSSKESAGIGGSAHLVNFMGTDTLEGIRYAMHYYDTDVCGHSVMASEHSVTCMYGREGEIDAYRSFIKNNTKGIISVVSDTYDFYKAVDTVFGKLLKDDILNRDGKFVVRPDSGKPSDVSVWTLNSLWSNFGGTVNTKGFKVLNPKVGVIYGDGIDYTAIKYILDAVTNAGFAPSNIIFGMGGALLQRLDRDTQKMAFKASWGKVNGIGREIWKETRTDPSKSSKRGRLKLVSTDTGFQTVSESDEREDVLVTVFENGKITKEWTFDEIRERANSFVD